MFYKELEEFEVSQYTLMIIVRGYRNDIWPLHIVSMYQTVTLFPINMCDFHKINRKKLKYACSTQQNTCGMPANVICVRRDSNGVADSCHIHKRKAISDGKC